MKRRIEKVKIQKLIFTLLVGAVSVIMLSPLLWMITTSFKIEADVFNFPVEWIPKRWNGFNNYAEVLSSKYKFANYYLNSTIYSVASTFLTLLICSACAYSITKINYKYKDLIFLVFLATMMIPPQLLIIPQFMLMRWANLYDTLWALILPASFSAYSVFILRQYMITIPDSITESAKIDGASHLMILFNIIMPMARPALATLAILKFVWTWNDYQNPLILIKTNAKYTLQLGIRQFATSDGTSQVYSLVMAGAVMSIIPLIIIFIIFQKQVIEGIAMGAVKG